MNKKILIYDGSLEGFLTSVFEVYEYKYSDIEICSRNNYSASFFSEVIEINTNEEKAKRVLSKLEKIIRKRGINQIICAFLSDNTLKEKITFEAIKKIIETQNPMILGDFSDSVILDFFNLSRSVTREAGRMKGFLRFEKMKDDIYISKMEPDHDIIPLLKTFLEQRFQDQKWMVFDIKRNYGLSYDLNSSEFVFPDDNFIQNLKKSNSFFHQEEVLYQSLWQIFFQKINIPERKNIKLHLQHLPKRYWKYLTEKNY